MVRGIARGLSGLRAGVPRIRADALAGGDGCGDGGGGGLFGESLFQEPKGVPMERADHGVRAGAIAGLWVECLAAITAAAASNRIETPFHAQR